MLNGATIHINAQTFHVTCPICHLAYSIILPGRNNTFYKRNFIDHLKLKHLETSTNIRSSVRNTVPPVISNTVTQTVLSNSATRRSGRLQNRA